MLTLVCESFSMNCSYGLCRHLFRWYLDVYFKSSSPLHRTFTRNTYYRASLPLTALISRLFIREPFDILCAQRMSSNRYKNSWRDTNIPVFLPSANSLEGFFGHSSLETTHPNGRGTIHLFHSFATSTIPPESRFQISILILVTL